MYSLYALITFTVMISLMYFYPCSIRILEVLFVEDCMLCTGDDMGCIRAAQNISHCVDILFYPNLITVSILVTNMSWVYILKNFLSGMKYAISFQFCGLKKHQ